MRQNLSTVPFHAGNRVTLEPGIVDGLSEEDIACTVILSSMMVHDGLAFSLSGIAVAGDSLHRITRVPYFWVEGWMVGNDIHSEIGTLPALSMEEARIAAAEFAESRGYGGTNPCSCGI